MRVVFALALLLAASLGGAVLATPAAEAQTRCLTRGEQRDAVREHQLKRPREVQRELGRIRLLSLALCVQGGNYVYLVRVLHPNGQVRNQQVKAR